MRRAKYDLQKVICPNSSGLGYSSNIAKPGFWIAYTVDNRERIARVLGRIAESQHGQGLENCRGFLCVMRLSMEMTHAGIDWVNPADVRACYEKPPAELLAWITGTDWVKNKGDIARLIAMAQHGTTSDGFIQTRNDPDKAYNARPEYVQKFILE